MDNSMSNRGGINRRCRFLYAIVTVDDPKFVKFGISDNPEKRFSSIQSSCPLELSLESFIPHSLNLEQTVHGSLVYYSVRGEWYYGCNEILRAVEIMKGGDVKLFSDYIDSLIYHDNPDKPDDAYWKDRGKIWKEDSDQFLTAS